MSRSGNPRRPWRRRSLVGAAVVGAVVVASLLTLGAASGRQVAQHGTGDRSAVHNAMSSTHSLSRAQGHASFVSRAGSASVHHSLASSDSSLFPAFGPNSSSAARSLAATGCGATGTIAAASGFEDADANLAVDTTGCMDWNGFAPVTWAGTAPYQKASKTSGAFLFAGATDAVGSNDTIYDGGAKQNDNCPGTGTGSVNNKDDLSRFYVAGEVVNGHSYLFLSLVRAPLNNTQADTEVAFEFNQSTTPCPNGDGLVNRTKGDLLISNDFQSGTPRVTVATWTGTDWSVVVALNLNERAVNRGGPVNDSLKPSGAPNPGTDEFIEAGIDLSSLDLSGTGGTPCLQFGTALASTRASDSTSSQMKDLLGPAPVDLSNCATPTIATQTSVSSMNLHDTTVVGDTATLTNGNNPTGNVSFQLYSNASCTTAVAGVSGTATLNGSGVATFPGASFHATAAGTYFWGVHYPGDSNNNAVTTCGGANEQIVVNAPSLTVTKTADAATVNAGDPIGFTITVANGGPGLAKDVTLSDPLPTGTAGGWSIQSQTNSGQCSISSGTLSCARVDLASGASYSVHVTAATSFAACTTYNNTATASASNAPNAAASASITCLKPSLSATKTADAATVNAGDPIGFTITVANGGPGLAKDVTLSDPLPAGTTAAGWSKASGPTQCSITGAVGSQTLACAAGDLASGGSFSIHVVAGTSATACTTYANTATAHASNAPDATASASITCNAPSLTVTKTADAATVNAGDPIGFTITVANGGPGLAKDVVLSDPLPAGLTVAGWSKASGPTGCSITGAVGSQTLACARVDLVSGQSYSVHITAATSFADCAIYHNTATAHASNAPDASASATITCNAPSLTVTKTADAATVNAGDPIGFTITVANGGPGLAKDVVLSDPLPAGLTVAGWSKASGPTGCSITGAVGSQTLACARVDLVSGQSYSVHITAATSFADCAIYHNTATAHASNAPDASASATITCNAPSLTVTKTADAATVDAGDPIGFTITVANGGPGLAKDVVLSDPLPAGLTVAGWSKASGPTGCSITGAVGSQTLACARVDLVSGQSYSVHITAATSFADCAIYHNTATAHASNAPDASASATITCNAPSLTVTKAADAATVSAGDPIGFTITVHNGGPGTAKSVTLSDPLPGGTTAAGWSKASGPTGCSITGAVGTQTLACTAVDLASGDSYSVHVTAATSFADCNSYDNTATASATNAPDASDSATITCQKPSLSVTKTADAATVDAGDPLGFTVKVANAGPGTASGVTLSDPLPAGTTAAGWTIASGPSQCSITGSVGSQTLACTAFDLASGGLLTVHVVARTSFADCTTYDNTATASASNSPDQSDSATITCQKPSLSVTKTADAATVDASDPIGFTITVANGGPGTAKGVTLLDPLPAGTTVAGWSIASGPAGCSIAGVVGSQTLDCSAVDLAAGGSYSVHVTAATSFAACTKYDNTATASASNSPDQSDSASVTCNAPSLTVTKTADAATVNAGDPIGFTITVANGGPGTAKGVTLLDPLPAGTTVAGWSKASGPAGCSIAGAVGSQTLDCSAVDLASGGSYSVHVTAATSFADCMKYDNTATASASNSPDQSDSASVTCNAPSLTVTKTADAATVNAGDPLGFTVTVANGGPGTAKGVTLADPLPAGTTAAGWTIASGPDQCSIAGAVGGQTLDCSAVDLAAGDSYSVHVTAATSLVNCTDYDNTATASATNAPDASASASIVCDSAQVSITKTADHSAPVNAGGQIGFTVEIKNAGPGTASGVNLNDPLPPGSGSGVTWVVDTTTGTPAQFVLSGAKGSQTLSLASSRVPAGSDYKVHVTAQTSESECGTYDNTATLTSGNANNPAPASASESCAFRVDLSITKSGSPASQALGAGNITWTMVVTNNGPDTDTGVTVADPMPAGNTFVSAATTQGSCTGGAILNCTIGTMAAGETVTITLVTTPSVAGTQTNTVNVAGDRPETNMANNAAAASVEVTAPFPPPTVFCVAVSKVTPKQLFVGRKTKLTIHVTQQGKAVKGIHVRITGPKINVRTKASNHKGVITHTLKMKKAGILIFSPIASKRCNTKRVGVTNVFTPPVTG